MNSSCIVSTIYIDVNECLERVKGAIKLYKLYSTEITKPWKVVKGYLILKEPGDDGSRIASPGLAAQRGNLPLGHGQLAG